MSSSISNTRPVMLPKLAERHVYGNEQQGRFLTKYPEELNPTYFGTELTNDIKDNKFSRQLGSKAYELKDHLGNVRVTHSDIKMPTGTPVQPFRVDLLTKSEYYPYGMVIEELSYNLSNNRYGFGGTHEMDNEVKGGVGNHLSFGEFGYDTRVGRRFNLDPERSSTPDFTPYRFAFDNPIFWMDGNGKSETAYTRYLDRQLATPEGARREIQIAKETAGLRIMAATIGLGMLGGPAILGSYGITSITSASNSLFATIMSTEAGRRIVNTLYLNSNKTVQTIASIVDPNPGADYDGVNVGKSLINAGRKILPKASEIFANSSASRFLAESYALATKYTDYKDANQVIKNNNETFDLVKTLSNGMKNVVDVTTINTKSKYLPLTDYLKGKLNALSYLSVDDFKERKVHIYLPEGKYTEKEINKLSDRIQNYINDNDLKNVKFEISEIGN
jgi:hypothetical protein